MKDIMFEDFEIAMKVVIVGNGSVGKSSMIQRYCRGIFTRDYKKTIGVDFLERVLTVDDQSIRLMLWDTAGQEEFDAITRTYYRGANACVIACSITDRDSFLALPKWKSKVAKECGDIPMVLVANKIDLQKQSALESSELETMAKSLGITKIFKTSVKDDVNVNSVFNHLAQTHMAMISALDEPEEMANDDDGYLLSSPVSHDISSNGGRNPSATSFNLFGKKLKKSSKKVGANEISIENNEAFAPHIKNPGYKGILRSPVILKQGNNPQHLHNPPLGLFSTGKNKLVFSPTHCNIANNNQSHARKNVGNGITLERFSYTYGSTKAPVVPSHGMPRWNDMSKYDNMPFRLDLVKPKKARRAMCTIL